MEDYSEFLIWIGIFLLSLLVSFIGKKKEEKKKAQEMPYNDPVVGGEEPALPDEIREKLHRHKAPQRRRFRPLPVVEEAPVQEILAIEEKPAKREPAPFLQTDEGQRAVVIKREAPKVEERTGLHDRENLKRAIIFGEILAPKF